ncbi:MAG: MBL fold metallo-hydrolase [Myxococcota bacterium]|nr:MBL fold metallo-hydrolase [Myxococcota bacterium]
MAKKQEQEPARREISEVAKNVLRMELPIRLPGLRHVNCYALVDDDGCAVVDPGLPGPSTYAALEDRLGQASLKVKDVHTVIVTHSHPDHFGGAVRLAKEAGAKVVGHDSFFFGVPSPEDEAKASVEDQEAAAEAEDAELEAEASGRPLPTWPPPQHRGFRGRAPWGGKRPGPSGFARWVYLALRTFRGIQFVPTITDPVTNLQVLRLAKREYFILHTPGHTEDHICLHCPEEEVFLSGDHVLPTITPHIGGVARSLDPLRTFYESLDLCAAIPHVKQVLPAHGHPFSDLAARCHAIQQHHDERLDKVREIARGIGPETVEAFSQRLFKQRSWGAMAESETYAHLEHLRLAGEAEVHRDRRGMLIYHL